MRPFNRVHTILRLGPVDLTPVSLHLSARAQSFVLQACAVPGILPLFARLLAQHGAVLVRTPEGKPPVWTTEKAALVLEKLVAADARVAQLARQFNVTPEHLRQWRSRVMVGESSELVERLMQVAPRLADTAASGVVKPSPTVFIRETRNIMGDQALAAAFQRHDMVLQYSGTRATPAWSTAKAGELLRDLVQHDAKIAQLAAQHNVTPTSLRIWRKNALKGQNADLVAALVQLVPTLRAID